MFGAAAKKQVVRQREYYYYCPKKLSNLIDPINLPSQLRDFFGDGGGGGGQSQMSRLNFFIRVWSYIKHNNLQDLKNRNLVNCDAKLKSVLLGRPHVELSELPSLIKLHFPKNNSKAK